MNYAKELREKLARLATELRAIVATAKNDGNRGLNVDERAKFAALEADYTAVEQSIKDAERIDAIENDLRTVDRDRIVDVIGGGSEADDKKNKELHTRAFSKYLRVGVEGLSAEEKLDFRAKFVGTLPNGIRNAQTITTTGGGYLIPTGFSDQLEDAMKFFGGILGQVGEFTTETGAPLPWPTDNDTSNTGRILGVNTPVTETDIVFGNVTFNSYIFTSDSVLVPLALIEDSYFNLDTFIAKKLGTRLGRLFNTKMTVGSGTNEPDGINTAAVAAGNVVTGATGDATSIKYADLVNVLHAVDPAYRSNPSSKWMLHDSTLKALRLLVDGSSRPLWQPGLTAGFGQAFPETILDRPYVINNDMPTMAANAYSVLYGDLSKYMVRRVASGTTVLRLVERYADYLQVGYIAFLRADGQLLDAGTHPIAVFRNSAT